MKSVQFLLFFALILSACKKDRNIGVNSYDIDPNFSPVTTDFNLFTDDLGAICIYENNFLRGVADSTIPVKHKWYLIDEGGDQLFLSDNPTQRLPKAGNYFYKRKGEYQGVLFDTVVSFSFDYCRAYVDFPDVFEPNNDGEFDFWGPIGEGISTIYFAVFDEKGDLLFEGNSISDSWDGQFQGKKMNPGTYNFQAKGSLKSGYLFENSGIFELIR